MNWQPVTIALSALTPWERNPKRISRSHAKRLLDLWERLGQFQTIAIGPGGEVYDGHQRLSVLKTAYGADYEVKALQSDRPLTEDERAELTISAHSGTVGTWDWDALSGWDAGQLQGWGFDAETLGDWRAGVSALDAMLAAEKEAPEDAGPQMDRAEELRERWGVESGQLWALGEHRIICGDCTDRAVVDRVMGGERAGVCVTSPPYPEAEMWETEGDSLVAIGNACLLALRDAVADGAAVCWNTADVPTGQNGVAANPARDTMAALGMGYTKRAEIVWEKGLSYLPPPWNTRRPTVPNITHELILVFYNGERVAREKDGNLPTDALAWNRETVWRISPAKASKENHKAPFPVELAERCLTLFSFPDDTALDPFIGSGTTLIACTRLGRRCRGIEISPAYVAVAIQRWVDTTGDAPILLDSVQT